MTSAKAPTKDANALSDAATIRLATEADLPEIMAILNYEIDHTIRCFRTSRLTDEDARQWWRGREAGRYPAWVAQRGSQIVGWASLSRWSAYEAYDRTAEVSVWIRPASQGQGIGRQFFSTLIGHAGTAKFRVLLSRIEATNEPSLALHERFGFTRVGTMHRVGEKLGQLLDVVIMERQLDENAIRASSPGCG